MRTVALGLLMVLAGCQPVTDGRDAPLVVAADSTYSVLDAVMPELVGVVESAWGTSAEWGRPVSERTTVRLVGALVDFPESPVVGVSSGHTPPQALDSAWTDRWIRNGAIRDVCQYVDSVPCKRGGATMAVMLGKPVWFSADSVALNVELDRATFAAGYRLIVSRRAGSWHVVAKRLRWIT